MFELTTTILICTHIIMLVLGLYLGIKSCKPKEEGYKKVELELEEE